MYVPGEGTPIAPYPYPPERREKLRAAHRTLLTWYGLTREEVPLLEYRGWAPALEPAPRGEAFVDVS